MKQTRLIMGMPVTVEIGDSPAEEIIEEIFDYFVAVDNRFSTYKPDSEISQINRGLPKDKWSSDMKEVMELCAQTKQATNGFFNIEHDGRLDPSGLVKGWAIAQAAEMARRRGTKNFYIEAGGDIQVGGQSAEEQAWKIGIRNPFNREEIVKVIRIHSEGVATSGTYIRGQHIYNPQNPDREISEVKSLTVIGPSIYEADRFATAAFAMGREGINFIEALEGFEAYMIDSKGIATLTTNFENYVA